VRVKGSLASPQDSDETYLRAEVAQTTHLVSETVPAMSIYEA